MKPYIGKIMIGVGVIPLVMPFLLGIYRLSIESWTWGSWLVLYSFVYWPTYIVGLLLIVAGTVMRRKKNVGVQKNEHI